MAAPHHAPEYPRDLWMWEVIVHELRSQRSPDERLNKHYPKVPVAIGRFLGFGVDFDDLYVGDDGVAAGTYSTAIILLDDGFLRNVPVSLVQVSQPAARRNWWTRVISWMKKYF